MATNTHRSVCRAQGKREKTKSQGCTKGADFCLCIINKTAVLYSNRDEFLSALRFYTYGAKLNKDKEVTLNTDFITKEDKLEYYISLV
jgi:hypothetical protein